LEAVIVVCPFTQTDFEDVYTSIIKIKDKLYVVEENFDVEDIVAQKMKHNI